MLLATLLAMATLISSPATVSAIPRPEHPRPDLQRAEWLNLNGTWEFAETDDSADTSFLTAANYPDKITVPFCRESELSGLGRKGFVNNVWYRRTFQRPPDWKAPRTVFHIGACDWRTTVWINGKEAGTHVGGSTPIDLDVTRHLKEGDNTVVIHAFDDTRSGLQALGKQCNQLDSYGCLYTRTTGIWQTVWLEGVGSSYLERIEVVPGVAPDEFVVRPIFKGDVTGMTATAKIVAQDGPIVDHAKSGTGADAVFVVTRPRLWSPLSPYLYFITIELRKGDQVVDSVQTYTGFRTVSVDGTAILINGQRVFQRLVLDQGFYPDGIWTAPSEDALERDIALSQEVGFNGARLHQKVFEPRFLYWADRMGYLVWGEFPNWGLNYADERVKQPVIDEWTQILERDRSHPSIIGWCPFNETPAEAGPLQNIVVAKTQELDPSRPIIDTSGYVHSVEEPQVMDAHDYDQNPETFLARWNRGASNNVLPGRYGGGMLGTVPFMVSEYGGIGWNTEQGWGYGDAPKSLHEFYARFKGLSDALMDNPVMFGFCYTQLTDVEQERNGIYTYNRQPKFDAEKLKAILGRQTSFERDIKAPVQRPANWSLLVGSARDGDSALPWKHSEIEPAPDWTQPSFDDGHWAESKGGFGSKGGFEGDIRSPWTGKDIWLRQRFHCASTSFERALLAIHYDNATQVYVNGKLVWKSAEGAWNDGYEGFDVTASLRSALIQGDNLIAVHCHQDDGGQFIDLALLIE